ncbi:MAG: hypothetical protein J3K34DRAFT_445929 [Monoraphidium minutum]|nr:MAG: hypothetical protein J3K34DRAFT_445929 [Monoraphidium minutum]
MPKLAAAAAALAALLLAAWLAPRWAPPADDGRAVRTLRLAGGKVFRLRLPTYTPPPEGAQGTFFVRNASNTCGLYTLSVSNRPPGSSPPIHLHYADDEWFMPGPDSRLKIWSAAKGKVPRPFTPGELPGFNVPSVELGSTELGEYGVLFSPKGSVHSFQTLTEMKDFIIVWAPGIAAEQAVRAAFDDNATAVLLNTALWGGPADARGKRFTGLDDFRVEAGGEVGVAAAHHNLRALQRLFDAGEPCLHKAARA